MKASNYMNSRRIDIDLLRAVAVLGVIFFHFSIPGFSGGFLGVDIFYVISGYLITLHVQKQLSESNFSFIYFYLRRIRRLFPALIATLFLSSIAALAILPKSLLDDFSSSQLASSLYVANVYFWSIADYFDTNSILKPLLHTWSLSVEEQFYIVWPLFLFLTFSKKPKLAISIAAILSLIAAEFVYDISSSATFYLFPFRIFEFTIGALMCRNSLGTLPNPVKNILISISIVSIALTMLISTEHTRNPGILTLPICLGTAIIIALHHPWMNINNTITSILLRIGLVSYSAYLVHWPLLVFYKIDNPQPLSPAVTISLLVITYVLAEIIYNFVEKPTSKINLREKKSLLFFSLPLVVLLALVFVFFQPKIYCYLNPHEYTVKHVLDNIPDRQLVLDQIKKEIEQKKTNNNSKKRRKIVVTGDSHAVDITLALQLLLADTDIEVELMHSICDPLTLDSIGISLEDLYSDASQEKTRNPEYCVSHHSGYLEKLTSLSPDLIIFSEAWRSAALPYLSKTINEIKHATSAKILILGRNPQFSPHPNIVFKSLDSIDEINKVAWERRYKIFDDYDKIFTDVANETGSYFISKNELVCPDQKCILLIGLDMGYTDGQHYSLVGLKYYGGLLVNHKSFKDATN